MCSIYEYRSVYCWSYLNVPQGHVTTEQETDEEVAQSTQAVSVFDENSLISFEAKAVTQSKRTKPNCTDAVAFIGSN